MIYLVYIAVILTILAVLVRPGRPPIVIPEPIIAPPLPVRSDFLAPGIQAIHDRYEAMANEPDSATGGPKLAGHLKYAEMLKHHGA